MSTLTRDRNSTLPPGCSDNDTDGGSMPRARTFHELDDHIQNSIDDEFLYIYGHDLTGALDNCRTDQDFIKFGVKYQQKLRGYRSTRAAKY